MYPRMVKKIICQGKWLEELVCIHFYKCKFHPWPKKLQVYISGLPEMANKWIFFKFHFQFKTVTGEIVLQHYTIPPIWCSIWIWHKEKFALLWGTCIFLYLSESYIYGYISLSGFFSTFNPQLPPCSFYYTGKWMNVGKEKVQNDKRAY